MKVGYFVAEDPKLASFRYRVMIPARELRRMGFETTYGVGDVTLFTKHWDAAEADVAKRLADNGGRVVFDICDDHFRTEHRAHYLRMCEIAHAITCSTPYLADRIREETGREATPITDPYEYPLAAPRLRSGSALKLLWYGHSSNRASWEKLRGLVDRKLLVCSDLRPDFECLFALWNREMMAPMFHWSDVVVLPVADTEKARGKSPNRLVEAVRQGRFVVANPIPSYEGYGMWLGEDIREGLAWVDANPEMAIVRVRDAQNKVEAFHSPRVVASHWRRVFIGTSGADQQELDTSESRVGSGSI